MTRRAPLSSDLRVVTLVVLLLAFVSVGGLQWLSARWFYDAGFDSAEHNDALSRARHVQAMLLDREDTAIRNAGDIGSWDDGYAYLAGHKPNHAALAFNTQSYGHLHLDAFAFLRPDGQVVSAGRFDRNAKRYAPAPSDFQADLVRVTATNPPPGAGGRRTFGGFANLGGRLYAWGAGPILRSDGTGPSLGQIVVAIELDADFLRSAEQIVEARVALDTERAARVPARVPLEPADLRFTITEGDALEADFALARLGAQGTLGVRVVTGRAVHAAAERSSRYLLFSTLAFGTILSALAMLFVERRLLRPLQEASAELVRIGATGDLSSRLIPAPREDQIASLIRAANGMLDRIQERDARLASGRQRLESELSRSAAILETLPDLLFELDSDGRYLSCHTPHTDLLAAPPARLVGSILEDVLPPAAAQTSREALQIAAREGVCMGKQIQLPLARGTSWFELSVARKATAPGEKAQFVMLSRDITERRSAEERIRHMAFVDGLTELPNRLSFLDRVNREIGRAQREGTRLGVLFLDLDGFKAINDTMGHDVGDQCLQLMAERLRDALRTSDSISRDTEGVSDISFARLGGDEFTALLLGIAQAESAWIAANRLRELLRRPFVLEKREVQLSASIGIALYPDDGRTAIELLKNADTAMYHAKEKGRDNCQFYSAALTRQAIRRLDLAGDLRHGLERGEFRLLYQPQCDARLRRICSVEALIRWDHPGEGTISPLEFIPLAEQSGLIVPIGEWVLRTACATGAAWQNAGTPVRMAVNLSPVQFRSPQLLDAVGAALADSGLAPGLLELEITEGAVMQDDGQTLATLLALRDAGVRIALDDFGTGYSSMQYLKRMPVSNLKVDRCFIEGLPGNAEDTVIVRAMVSMAKSLGFAVTAEGVETLAQAQALVAMACDTLQGYYFSRPLEAADIPPQLTRTWALGASEASLAVAPA